MKTLKQNFPILIIALLWASQARADNLPILVHLDLTGDEKVADRLPSLNAEVLVTLEKSGKYQLVSQEQLEDKLLMGPVENLKFCDFEPSCVASMGATVKASRLLYGDVKLSFDGTKTLVHLVLIDVPGGKLAKEKHGQFISDSAGVATADMLRDMLGLMPSKVRHVAQVLEPPPSNDKAITIDKTKKNTTAAISSKPPAKVSSVWKNPLTWSTAGTGVVCLATATTLGLLCLDRQNQAKALATGGDPLGAEERFADAKDMAMGANILFGVGSAALAAAIVFIVLDITDDTLPSAIPVVSCKSASCSGWLAVSF